MKDEEIQIATERATRARSEFRYDPIADRWAIVAEGRADRPSNASNANDASEHDPECPFCPGAERRTTATVAIATLKRGASTTTDSPDDFEILEAANAPNSALERPWRVRVVANKYPAFTIADSDAIDFSALDLPAAEDCALSRAAPAVGRHEVIVDSARHLRGWREASDLEVALTFRVFRARLRALRATNRFGCGFVFKNVGANAGASQTHSHCQLTALVAVPPEIRAETRRLARIQSARPNFWDEFVAAEQRSRAIYASERFLVHAPFASRFPMQVEIAPRFDRAFEDYEDAEVDELASLARRVVAALERAHRVARPDDPPLDYNVFMRPAPWRGLNATGMVARPRWVFLPSLVKKAGFELGCALDINPVAPERAAAILREFWPSAQ